MVEDNKELFKHKLELIYKNYEYFSKIPLVKETIIQVPDEVLLRLDGVLERLYDDVPDGVDKDYSIRNDIMINAFCFYLKIANSLKENRSPAVLLPRIIALRCLFRVIANASGAPAVFLFTKIAVGNLSRSTSSDVCVRYL